MADKPIIVAFDGSRGARCALSWALDEGARTGRSVQVMHILERVGALPRQNGGRVTDPRAEAESIVARVATEAHDRGQLDIAVTGYVAEGSVAFALCERSRSAALIVLGERGRGGFSGLRMGSVSLHVAAHAYCPVVVVRDQVRMPDRRPVAVGVDDSPEGTTAMEFAFAEAASRGVGLLAVRAWMPSPAWPTDERRPVRTAEDACPGEERILDDAVTALRDRYPQVNVTTRLVRGTATHALTVASHDAQLLVVGSRGGGGFAGLPLGSSSQQLLHHAVCSVMIVRGSGGPPTNVA